MKSNKKRRGTLRLTSIVLSILLLIFATFSLQGCIEVGLGANGGNNTSSAQKEEKTTITLHNGDSIKSFEVTVGKQAQIDECVKQGCYVKGYYTKPDGGERYFSADGKSLSEWDKSYPDEFYVQYAPISEFSYTTTFTKDKITTFSYNLHATIALKGELKNAISANLDKSIVIKVSFNAADTSGDEDWVIYYKNTDSYNEGNLRTNEIANKYHGFVIDADSTYKTYSGTSTIPASTVYAGESLVCFFSRGASFGDGKIKTITFEIVFE